MSGRPDFEMLYSIMTNRKFLSMEGLGKEVPFFVHTYDISLQDAVFTGITSLQKRLVTSGTDTLLIGLYDMVIDYFKDHDELEDIFDFEKNSTKDLLFQELVSIFNSDDVIKPNVRSRLDEADYKLVIIYQVGDVFPYLRTHNLLNWLQSVITDIPLVVFFPGDYITSNSEGFKLNLFGKFSGPYYRAFRLEDYTAREAIND